MQKGSGRIWFVRRIALLRLLLAAAIWLYGCGGGVPSPP